MSRSQGRRIAERPQHDGAGPLQLVAAVLLVALTIGALFAAGTTDHATGSRPVVTSRLDLGARNFVCTDVLPGTRGVAGTLSRGGTVTVDGRAQRAPSFAVRDRVRVVADRSAAPGAYAVQGATARRWLAATACPEPRPTWWFVGAGASDDHDTVLTVANPKQGSAIFDVDVIGPDGPVDAPGLHGLTLATGQTRRLDLTEVAPATGELAVRVRTSRGLVAVGAAESWAPALIGKRVREWVAPQPFPARDVDLAGIAGSGSGTLVVANPGEREAIVQLRLVGKGGTFDPTSHDSLTVPAGSVREVDLTGVLRAGTAAVRLTANVPVLATLRSVHQGDEAYAAAAQPLHGTATAGVPPGAGARLVLSSVTTAGTATDSRTDQQTGQHPATARLRVVGRDGRQLLSRTTTVPAAGSVAVALPRRSRAVGVTTAGGDVVGAVVLRSGPGIAAVSLSSQVTAQRRPGVLPGW